MKYREFLKEQTRLVEMIGEKKYKIVQTIFQKSNGKVSFKEALSIVSTLSENETNSIQCDYLSQSEVNIITEPHIMALHLGIANKEIFKVLFGKCEFKGFDEADFELNDRLAVLINCRIYIYIPHGEYI